MVVALSEGWKARSTMIKKHRPLNTVLTEINSLIDELSARHIYIQDDLNPEYRLINVEYSENEDAVWFRTEEIK